MQVKSFLHEESGATAVEYGLIAALIALVISGTLMLLGTSLNAPLETISNTLKN